MVIPTRAVTHTLTPNTMTPQHHGRRSSKKDKKQIQEQELDDLRNAHGKLANEITDSASALSTSSHYKYFSDICLSYKTRQGLEANHFVELTEIQRLAIPAALARRDILGAAETGSGKTLAFLVPVLERLYLEGWSVNDGLGALILSPTRELAIQTFQILRKIGSWHTFSAGLIIGGKDLQSERSAIARMNILVATPGRLLQHMDQAVGFEWGNLQLLVLDEADRILDLGFSKTVDAIVRSLPSSDQRQTLLLSATQTDSVESLARLSLSKPIFICTTSQMSTTNTTTGFESITSTKFKTPIKLNQFVLFTALSNKLDHLWSFVKQHLDSKIIVFVSSCKQVRFIFESYCRLQPGIPLLHLHGKQKQPRRMTVFAEFCRKKAAVLIATDIAARGLDFPAVDWVVQVDCPEDVETYVHRVGRTARYDAKGNALLLLLPTESEMLRALTMDNSFSISPMHGKSLDEVIPKISIKGKLQSLCSQNPELKYLAQKSLISYVRSIFLQPNKSIFSVKELPLDDFATSLGLFGVPKLRFIDRQSNSRKNVSHDMTKSLIGSDEEETKIRKTKRSIDKMFLKKNTNVLSDHYSRLREEEDDDTNLLTLKCTNDQLDDHSSSNEFKIVPPSKHVSSRRDILKTKKRYRMKNSDDRATRLVFDEDTGEASEALPFQPECHFDRSTIPSLSNAYLTVSGKAMVEADGVDKERVRQARRVKRISKKHKAPVKFSSDPSLGSPPE